PRQPAGDPRLVHRFPRRRRLRRPRRRWRRGWPGRGAHRRPVPQASPRLRSLTKSSAGVVILSMQMPASRRARRLRWLAPVAIAAAIGLVALLPTLSSAATPDLPTISPEQLVAKVKQSNVQAFSGTFQLTTDLGIPNLSALQGAGEDSAGFNPAELLSGTHSATIAVDGPDRQRVSMPGSLNEVDAFHDGQNACLWESDGHKATHVILPADR